jgi:hypothetical protein
MRRWGVRLTKTPINNVNLKKKSPEPIKRLTRRFLGFMGWGKLRL